MELSPAFRAALRAELDHALPDIVERALAASGLRLEPIKQQPRARSIQEQTPRRRLAKGLAKHAVLKAVRASHDKGASRKQVREMARPFLNGVLLNEHTLKRTLMDLRESGQIETRNSRWYDPNYLTIREQSTIYDSRGRRLKSR